MLPGTACADRHVGIDDVECLARCQQSADVRRIHPVEVRNVSRRLTNQAGQPDLPLRPPDSLGRRGRRNRDAGTGTRRSFRSSAIRLPASKATPGIKPLTCPRYPAPHRPGHARCRTALRRCPAAPRQAERPTPAHHPGGRRRHASHREDPLVFKYLTPSAKYLTISVKLAMGGGGPSVLSSSISWFASSMSGCSIPWRSCWKAVERSNPRGP
jgi:hypothetical protein